MLFRSSKEFGVKDDDIIGVMRSFVRNGNDHSVDERLYRIYTGFILNTVNKRVLFKRGVYLLKSALKALKEIYEEQ